MCCVVRVLCTFCSWERHDWFFGGQTAGEKVISTSRSYSSPDLRRWGTKEFFAAPALRLSLPLPLVLRLAVTVLSVRWPLAGCAGVSWDWCSGSVANLSAPHPTRLETRTKESNMCASHGALRNLKAQ